MPNHLPAPSDPLDQLKPTPRAIYRALVQHKREHDGNSPTFRELCQAAGVRSTSQVMLELKRLELMGLIKVGHGSRNISVSGGRWSLSA